MAILKNLLLSGAKNGLSDIVLYKLNGQQIARSKPASVANPRTTAQMTQRIKLANVVNFYRANRSWMPRAFEHKERIESDYNAFVRANLSASRVALTKEQAAAGAAVVYPYQVAQGSLPPYSMERRDQLIVSDLYLGNDFTFSANTTIGEFSAAVVANNNSDQAGDQFSIIQVIQYTNPVSGIPYLSVRSFEVILDPDDTQLLNKWLPVSIMRNEGGSLAIVTSGFSGGIAFIQSRTVGAQTYVSSAALVVTSTELYAPYTSQAAITAAINSYGRSTEVFLDAASAGTENQSAVAPQFNSIGFGGQTYAAGSYIANAPSTGSLTATFSALPSELTLASVTLYDRSDNVIGTASGTATSTSGTSVTLPYTAGTYAGPVARAVARFTTEDSQSVSQTITFSTTNPNAGSGGGNTDNPDGIE